MTETSHSRVALIGSYVPRQCGIATFTHDLASALSEEVYVKPLADGKSVRIVALNDRDNTYTYGPEVAVGVSQHHKEDYRTAAEVLNTSKIDVVCVQHEYGLFGGEAGEYLLELLARLRKPVVATLHTVLSEPNPKQLEVLQRLCRRCSAIVVMAERARMLLTARYDVEPRRIRLIPHGVPDVPFTPTEPFKERFGLSGRPTMLTFGLLGPGKGIETMLDALAKVIPDHPDVAYIVLGVTHPSIRRESGELYRLSLERRATSHGIDDNVLFHNRYVSLEDLRDYLQAADVYATPYPSKEQITSGTLAYALASGRAIVSTPYWHAQELLANGRGRLVDFGDSEGFACALRDLLEHPDRREAMRRSAWEFGRRMVWPRVAEQYAETFEQARAQFAAEAPSLLPARKVLLRMSLPAAHLDHMRAMTDGTGMLQHSVYATPDRRHGYCVDDNARALIVSSMAWTLFQDDSVVPYLNIYLSFLHYAYGPENGRFRNFMSYERRWLDEQGSHDCHGRALWALGYLVSHPPNEPMARLAGELFSDAAHHLERLADPRSWALGILGLHYYLRRFNDDDLRAKMAQLADRLQGRFVEKATSDWPWFEDLVTYDNGRIPQALIIAGLNLGRQDLVDRGLRALQWLLDVQTASQGHLTVIGSNGWLRRSGERARYDQQPLEAAALIGACKAAYRASEDARWLAEMRRCFEWFLGRNDGGVTLIDFKSRGCYDGLGERGANENQGAEAVLSWLLALLIMHEMQTGDVPEVG